MTARANRRGAQAPASLKRRFTCEACGRPRIQKGPGRSRRFCTSEACQRKAKRIRASGLHRADWADL